MSVTFDRGLFVTSGAWGAMIKERRPRRRNPSLAVDDWCYYGFSPCMVRWWILGVKAVGWRRLWATRAELLKRIWAAAGADVSDAEGSRIVGRSFIKGSGFCSLVYPNSYLRNLTNMEFTARFIFGVGVSWSKDRRMRIRVLNCFYY